MPIDTIKPSWTRYELPEGAIVYTRKPKNQDRRVLAAQPESNMRFFTEITAASVVERIELPAGYGDEDPAEVPAMTITFDALKDAGDPWPRLDVLTTKDATSYSNAYAVNNSPNDEIVQRVAAAAKASLGKPATA